MPLQIVDTVQLFWWLVPQGSRDRQPLHKSWSGLSTSVPGLGTSLGAVSIIPLRHLTAASATGLDWPLYFTNFSKLPLMWRVQHRNHWSTVSDFSDNFNPICGIFRGFQLSCLLTLLFLLYLLPCGVKLPSLGGCSIFCWYWAKWSCAGLPVAVQWWLLGREVPDSAGFRCAQSCSWAAFSDALRSQLGLELAWNSLSALVHARREHEEKFRENRQLPFANWTLWRSCLCQ